MPTPDRRSQLAEIKSFPQLVKFLRDEMGWPISSDDFEELTFDYTAEELGIDAKNAAKIQEIKRLRPLAANQPWGIFFVKFEPRNLPVVALRRILNQIKDPDTEIEVHGITKIGGLADQFRYLEYLETGEVMENVQTAMRNGFDAFLIGNIGDPGIRECREIANIPVLGL